MATNDELAVDRLVDKLTKPIYQLRMNKPQATQRKDPKDPKKRSADTQLTNARRAIHEAVMEYAEEHQ